MVRDVSCLKIRNILNETDIEIFVCHNCHYDNNTFFNSIFHDQYVCIGLEFNIIGDKYCDNVFFFQS